MRLTPLKRCTFWTAVVTLAGGFWFLWAGRVFDSFPLACAGPLCWLAGNFLGVIGTGMKGV